MDRAVLKFEQLERVLSRIFDPLHVVNKLPDFVSTEAGTKIRNTSTIEERFRIFFRELKVIQLDNGNIMVELVDILSKDHHYEWIQPMLSDTHDLNNFIQCMHLSQKSEKIHNTLRRIYPGLNTVRWSDVIDHVEKYLTEADIEKIKKVCDREGNGPAFYVLINKLVRSEPMWIHDFIKGVEEANLNATNDMFDGFSSLSDALKDLFGDFPTAEEIDQSFLPNAFSELSVHDNESAEHVTHENTREKEIPSCCVDEEEISESPSYSNEDQITNDLIQPEKTALEADASMDTSTNGSSKPSMELRNYQKELCKQAKAGESVIICAPTGSGKTYIAASIIENHLECVDGKVVFFAPTAGLAAQQFRKISEYLPYKSTILMRGSIANDTPDFDIERQIYNSTIIVMTPQILINAIKKGDVKSIFDFSMMVFDECHHTTKGHQYNELLVKYLEGKRDNTRKIQIIGMTATLGIGQARNEEEAMEHIITLCGSLDAAGGIVTVREKDNITELNQMFPEAAQATESIERGHDNPFKSVIDETMDKLIELAEEIQVFTELCTSKPKKNVRENNQQFEQWCNLVQQKAGQLKQSGSSTLGRDARSFTEALKVLIDAMDLCSVCRPVDAVRIVQGFIKVSYEQGEEKNTKAEMRMHEMMQCSLEKLNGYKDDAKCQNENLSIIERSIIEKLQEDPKSRIMLMVPKRIYTSALKDWMLDTATLKDLNAEVFTGIGKAKSSHAPSLTHIEQEKILKSFNNGDTKIIVCTPDAAGEGMDIQDCNLVIEYDYMTNEISKVQMSGRARKANSEVLQIASEKVGAKEGLTLRKIHLMNRAMRGVQKLHRVNPEIYQKKMEVSQKRTISNMKLAEMRRNTPPVQNPGQYELQCRKCSTLMCMSSDIIRLDGSQHSVHNNDFKSKYEKREHPRKGDTCGPANMVKQYKLHCIECKHDWGIMVSSKGFLVPLVRIQAFKIIGEGLEATIQPTKWKNVPFRPRNLDWVNDDESGSLFIEFLALDLSY